MIRKILFSLLIFGTVLDVLHAQERDLMIEAKLPTANTFVLLIGINMYPPEIPSLEYCVRDTEGLAASMKKIGVSPDQVIVMVDDAKEVSLRPSRSNIIRQIEIITGLVTENDLLVVTFSGHGAQIDGEAYLCPNDTDLEKPNSFLSRKWVYDMLENCAAKKKLFITDACRNEITVRGARSVSGVRSLADPLGDADSHGFALLASCSRNQKSYEDAAFKHGVFTYFIIQGLEGNADENKDDLVTFEELYVYVMKNTRSHVFKTRRTAQVPMRGGEYSGDFVLASVRKTAIPTTPAPLFRPESPGHLENATGEISPSITANNMRFIPIRPGSFTMGDTRSPHELATQYGGTAGIYESARPAHEVRISRSFYISESLVTVSDFRQFVDEMGYKTDPEKTRSANGIKNNGTWGLIPGITWNNPGFEQKNKHPVVCVSWNDAVAYVKWMNDKHLPKDSKSMKFSLPTEAQWEYACRAGTTTEFSWGNSANAGEGFLNAADRDMRISHNTGLNSPAPFNDGYWKTSPVGIFKPNPWGLYDMHGNVWEWCRDWHDDYSRETVTDPQGPTSGSKKVVRGGSWTGDLKYCRSAFRSEESPSIGSQSIGFRLVLEDDNR